MKKTWKLTALFLVVLLVVSLVGCTPSAPSSSSPADGSSAAASNSSESSAETSAEPITITVWHVWGGGAQADYIQNAIKTFEDENPGIKIEATSFESDSFQVQGLKTAVAANEFADVTHAWGGAMVQPFVEAGKVLCLDEYLTDEFMERLMPGTLGGMTFDGKVYGLPYLVQPCVVIYNKALFDEYALEIPDTYDQLLEAVKVFRENDITPLCLGEKELWTGMMYYDMMAVRYLGVDACNDILAGKAPYDSDDMLKVTNMFTELVGMEAFDPGVVALSRYEAEMEFKMGKIPVLLEGSWVLGDVLLPEDSAIKDTAVIRSFPTIEGGKGDRDILGGANDAWIVNASTKYPDEAFQVCSGLISSVALDCYANNVGIAAWNTPEGFDDSLVSSYFKEIKSTLEASEGSMLYWDNILSADLTMTHKNLVMDMYAQQITAEDFVKQMQDAIAAG